MWFLKDVDKILGVIYQIDIKQFYFIYSIDSPYPTLMKSISEDTIIDIDDYIMFWINDIHWEK